MGHYDKNDVLARPALVALNNKKSDFFQGGVYHSGTLPHLTGKIPAGLDYLSHFPLIVDFNLTNINHIILQSIRSHTLQT